MTNTTAPIGTVNCWLVAPDDGATAVACGCVRTCALNGANINRFEETDPKAKPVGVGQYANGLPFPVWDAADIRTDEGDRLLPDNTSRHHRIADDYESGGAVPDTAMLTCQPDPDDTSTRQEVFQFGVLHACDAIQPHTAFGYTDVPAIRRVIRELKDATGMVQVWPPTESPTAAGVGYREPWRECATPGECAGGNCTGQVGNEVHDDLLTGCDAEPANPRPHWIGWKAGYDVGWQAGVRHAAETLQQLRDRDGYGPANGVILTVLASEARVGHQPPESDLGDAEHQHNDDSLKSLPDDSGAPIEAGT